MKIEILKFIEGAKQAKGLVIIIDVFRAMSVECYALNNNAGKIFAVGEESVARELYAKQQNAILIGERNGIKLDGFNFGNSPSEIENVDFLGKTIIHTTSAGTQGITSSINADEVITGSLVNAKAIADYIKSKKPEIVSLVCMGWNGNQDAEEDNICAEYIKSLIENEYYDIKEKCEQLKYTAGAKFFDKSNTTFPERDFWLCTDINKFNFIIKATRQDNYFVMNKISI